MVPDRAGADTRVDVVIPLSDLLAMDSASIVEGTWLRARAGEHGYLTGKDAQAVACDALIVPVVAGAPDWAVIGEMITLIADAHAHPHADAADDPSHCPTRCPPKRGRPCSTPSPAWPSASSPGPGRWPRPFGAACSGRR